MQLWTCFRAGLGLRFQLRTEEETLEPMFRRRGVSSLCLGNLIIGHRLPVFVSLSTPRLDKNAFRPFFLCLFKNHVPPNTAHFLKTFLHFELCSGSHALCVSSNCNSLWIDGMKWNGCTSRQGWGHPVKSRTLVVNSRRFMERLETRASSYLLACNSQFLYTT